MQGFHAASPLESERLVSEAAPSELEPVVYWERQGEDSLCAVHCLNSLLQGPEFTPFTLADIALNLDREEAKLGLVEETKTHAGKVYAKGEAVEVFSSTCGGWCPGFVKEAQGDAVSVEYRYPNGHVMNKTLPQNCDFLRVPARGTRVEEVGASTNVSASGNFSSQTIIQALLHWNAELTVDDAMHPDVHQSVAEFPALERAYICNRRNHWLVLRRIPWHEGRETWFNLDSRLLEGPDPLSNEQLHDLVHSMLAEGFTIFVVRGPLPLAFDRNLCEQLVDGQMLLHQELISSMQLRRQARICAEDQLNNAVAHELLDLAKRASWDELLRRLSKAEASRKDPAGPRYVDHVPVPRKFGILHFAAHQKRPQEVRRLLRDFGANPALLTRDGLSAFDIATAEKCETVLEALRDPGSNGGQPRGIIPGVRGFGIYERFTGGMVA